MARVDNHELAELAADLRRAPRRVERDGRRIIKRGALEIKREMGKEFDSHDYTGKLRSALEFQSVADDGLAYEIGELNSAGPSWGIGAILAYGTANNAPVVDLGQFPKREAFTVERHLGAAGEQAILGDSGETARL